MLENSSPDDARLDATVSADADARTASAVIPLSTRGRLVLPAEVRSALNVRKGALLLVEVADGRAELIPLELVPRDQLWFHTAVIQERIVDAEHSLLAADDDTIAAAVGPKRNHTSDPECSPAFNRTFAAADPNTRRQISSALRLLRVDPSSVALRVRDIKPQCRYLEARVGYGAALILRRVGEVYLVLDYIHHRDRARAAAAFAGAASFRAAIPDRGRSPADWSR